MVVREEKPDTKVITEAPKAPAKKPRLAFLDWTRGMAALIMLQGHVFHSFARPDVRESGTYAISQFVGGIAPAIFLFLTGVTLAFLMNGMERKGASGTQRFVASLRRAGYLLTVALLFRIQLWLFAWPQSPWTDLLKVDILNCMALSLVFVSVLAVVNTEQRIRGAMGAGFAIAVASPVVSMLDLSFLPEIVRMYLVPDGRYFSFFPWASFVAFGVGTGSVFRLVTGDQMHRVMQWAAIIGFGLVTSGQYFSNLPYSLYPTSDFWLNSPGLIFIKLGVILLLLAFTFLWTQHGAAEGWSWVQQIGTTSLIIYWVHIELVYGRWFGYWKENLSYVACVGAALTLWGLMLLLSVVSTRYGWRGLRQWFNFVPNTQPESKTA